MTRQSCSISSISAASAWRTNPPSNDPDAASQNAAAAAADAHKGSASRASAWSEPSSPGSISNEISSPVSARRATTNRPSTPSAAYSKSSTTSSSWHAAEYSRRGLPGVTNARGAPRCAPVRYGLRRVHSGRRGKSTPSARRRRGASPSSSSAAARPESSETSESRRAPPMSSARTRARVSATANAPSSASFESPRSKSSPIRRRAPRGAEGSAARGPGDAASLASGLVWNENPSTGRDETSALVTSDTAACSDAAYALGDAAAAASDSETRGAVTAASRSGSPAIFATTARYLSTSLTRIALSLA